MVDHTVTLSVIMYDIVHDGTQPTQLMTNIGISRASLYSNEFPKLYCDVF